MKLKFRQKVAINQMDIYCNYPQFFTKKLLRKNILTDKWEFVRMKYGLKWQCGGVGVPDDEGNIYGNLIGIFEDVFHDKKRIIALIEKDKAVFIVDFKKLLYDRDVRSNTYRRVKKPERTATTTVQELAPEFEKYEKNKKLFNRFGFLPSEMYVGTIIEVSDDNETWVEAHYLTFHENLIYTTPDPLEVSEDRMSGWKYARLCEKYKLQINNDTYYSCKNGTSMFWLLDKADEEKRKTLGTSPRFVTVIPPQDPSHNSLPRFNFSETPPLNAGFPPTSDFWEFATSMMKFENDKADWKKEMAEKISKLEDERILRSLTSDDIGVNISEVHNRREDVMPTAAEMEIVREMYLKELGLDILNKKLQDLGKPSLEEFMSENEEENHDT